MRIHTREREEAGHGGAGRERGRSAGRTDSVCAFVTAKRTNEWVNTLVTRRKDPNMNGIWSGDLVAMGIVLETRKKASVMIDFKLLHELSFRESVKKYFLVSFVGSAITLPIINN